MVIFRTSKRNRYVTYGRTAPIANVNDESEEGEPVDATGEENEPLMLLQRVSVAT